MESAIRGLFDGPANDEPPAMPAMWVRQPHESPEQRATRRIEAVLREGHPAVLGFSAGKDSSVLAAITLATARRLVEAGQSCPPIVVVTADTGVEQPEIVALAASEIQKMERFAQRHSIPFAARVSRPRLGDTWPVRVIGGRGLPPWPSTRSDCSIDWKVLPNQRTVDALFAQWRIDRDLREPVIMTGVRINESVARNARIAGRGEVAEGIWRNELGKLRLSPILDWATDDVWEYLGYANAGVIEAYSTFEDTIRIYRSAGGGCMIVADTKADKGSKPCQSRFGCWACTRVAVDRSMANMIESDETRYGHLRPLARLRDYIANVQYDWSKRQYVGRTIDDDGNIAIQADTFNPEMLKALLRYTLTAQALSGVSIISEQQLVAIDARWSLYALCPPFTALQIFQEVQQGKLEEAPEIPRFQQTPAPRIGAIEVGAPTYGSALGNRLAGLRHVAMELFSESCGFELRSLRDGALVVDCESDDQTEVDPEGAALFLELEAERHVAEYCHERCVDWTWGFKTYLSYGTIRIAKGRSQQTDAILKRSQWRQENDLHGYRSPKELEARCSVLFERQLALL